jgi:hypothetical protein
MTNFENTTTANAIANPDKDKDKLLRIIWSHFPDTDPSQFYDNCQSGRLLGLAPEEAQKVRNCYQAIRNNGLLPLFWQEFKAYRQTVKDRYRTNTASRKKRWCSDDVVHNSPNIWKWNGITAIVDTLSRSIKIIDTTTALYRYCYQLDYSWNPLRTTNPSMAELNRVKKAMRAKGLIQEINRAISELG